jgi:HSP20 family molecular chaperone IbpA
MSTKKKSKTAKPSMTPNAYIDHDEKNYYIQIDLPGVKKADVELTVSDQSFCVRAVREDIEFLGCYVLAHVADTEKAKAKLVNGLLSMEIPLKKLKAEKKVLIE